MQLNAENIYSRKENVLYENEVGILKFKQNFINLENLNSNAISYMQSYIEMFPDLVELIQEEKQQLTLF